MIVSFAIVLQIQSKVSRLSLLFIYGSNETDSVFIMFSPINIFQYLCLGSRARCDAVQKLNGMLIM